MLGNAVISLLRPLQFRGKQRLLAPIAPKSGEVVADVFGYRMRLDLSDISHRSIYMSTYEPAEISLLRSLLRPGMTFVDVGANVGVFTLLAASLVRPHGRVIAVEPSPWAVERLRATVAVNQIESVQIVHAGLSDASGTLPLFMPQHPGNHTPTMTAQGPDTIPVDVPVITLDELVSRFALERIDVLKADVEGHEPRVFAGGRQSLQRGVVRDIFCEFNDEWLTVAGTSAAELDALLRGFGFANHTEEHRVLRRGINRHYRWAGAARPG